MKTHPASLAVLAATMIATGLLPATAQLPSRAADPKKEAERKAKFIKDSALRIDKLIGLGFRRSGEKPIAKAEDAKFVRRIYLDTIGRIPTYDETVAFLNDSDPDKRQNIIAKLLNSPGYLSHQFNYFADILRAKSDFEALNTSGRPYINWIKQSIAENKPYDEMVRNLLTTTGNGWEDGKGAVGYYVRDNGMPLDNMANTTRIFLGTSIACAQCHDHPYDDWKQKDFFEMSAFTHGLKGAKANAGELVKGDDRDTHGRDLYNFAQLIQRQVVHFGISGGGDGMIPLPDDYQYRDAKPGEYVAARTLFGKRIRNGKRKKIDDGREMFAEWVTSPTNPRFTKVIANRIWKRIMAIGVFEPVDDLQDETKIPNAQLLSLLEEIMIACKYDLRTFQHILLSTRVYELGTNPRQITPAMKYSFNGRALQRMSAEQIWDSMLALTIPDSDMRLNDFTRKDLYYKGKAVLVGKKSMEDIWNDVKDMDRPAFWTYIKDLYSQVKSSGGKSAGSESMMMSMKSMGGASHAGLTSDPRWKGFSLDLRRASELESPAPPSHFLRKFGQSSRDVIEGATSESDVTQILSLINGHVEKTIIGNKNSVIYKNLAQAKSTEDKIKVVFLSILNREPEAAELATVKESIGKDETEGIDNLIWALLNNQEFLFIQ